MKSHNTERISALADGELKGLTRWLTRRHMRHCPQCAAEFQRLQRVHEVITACPPAVEMSDSADFFWSKVRRDIEARDQETISIPMPRLSLADWLMVHRAALATITSGLVVLLSTAVMLQQPSPTGPGAVMVERVDTVIPNTVATPLKGADADVECFENLET
jgi:hypothetical protein